MNTKKMILGVMMTLSVTMISGCTYFIKDRTKEAMTQLQTTLKVFPITVNEVNDKVEAAIKAAQQGLDVIKKNSAPRNFENTVRAYDVVDGVFSQVSSAISITEYVHPNKEMREACHEAALKLHAFALDAFLVPEFYEAFKVVAQNGEQLDAQEQYFLDESLKGFKKAGLDKSAEELAEIKRLQKELAKLGMEFEANIAKDQRTLAVSEAELQGLTPEFIAHLKRDDAGGYILNTTYPIYFEVMAHCLVSDTRKKLDHLFKNRAYPINHDVLEKVIALRHELAQKLGYASFADYNLDDSMAQTPNRASSFILDLLKKAQQKAIQEFDHLKENLPVGVALTCEGKFNPWDYGYAKECYKQKAFQVDDREIQEYFPLEKTIDGIFAIYQKFLGLRFEKIQSNDVWYEDVTVLAVYDAVTNNLMGYTILDLHPRDNKFTHACHAGILPAVLYSDGSRSVSLGVMIANFPKATKDKPSLLKHKDVVTFFHEFGHAMHHLMGATKMMGSSGTHVKRDFVEMPSQMFEEWMWDKEMLALLSCHYKTGKPLPSELVDKMLALKNFDSGFFVARQCWLSQISLGYFAPGATKDISGLEKSLGAAAVPFVEQDPQTHSYASFGHLMGYGAKYYGYMWSKVFALDLFNTIKGGGLLCPEMGKKFVTAIFSKGGSQDPNELLVDFLGREPNQEAFLKDLGL